MIQFGAFLNGESVSERVLAQDDEVSIGPPGDTEIVFEAGPDV